MIVAPLTPFVGHHTANDAGSRLAVGTGRATQFRYIIDAMRQAVAGSYGGTSILEGVAVALGLTAVCLATASAPSSARTPDASGLLSR